MKIIVFHGQGLDIIRYQHLCMAMPLSRIPTPELSVQDTLHEENQESLILENGGPQISCTEREALGSKAVGNASCS